MSGWGVAMQRTGLVVGPMAGVIAVWTARHGARFTAPGRAWAVPVGVVVCALAVLATPRVRQVAPWPGAVSAVYAGCLGVAYLCVPETDHIERMAPVFAAVVAAEVVTRRSLPAWIQWFGAPVVASAALFGATGRQSALVGGLFAVWPVLLIAIESGRSPDLALRSIGTRVGVVALGGLAAFCVARTGGLQPTVAPALMAVAVAAPTSILAADRLVHAARPRSGAVA